MGIYDFDLNAIFILFSVFVNSIFCWTAMQFNSFFFALLQIVFHCILHPFLLFFVCTVKRSACMLFFFCLRGLFPTKQRARYFFFGLNLFLLPYLRGVGGGL